MSTKYPYLDPSLTDSEVDTLFEVMPVGVPLTAYDAGVLLRHPVGQRTSQGALALAALVRADKVFPTEHPSGLKAWIKYGS